MARILLLTDDTRLYRLIFLLLCEEGHTVVSDTPNLVITDKKELSSRLSALPVMKIGEGGLPRPFSHTAFKSALREHLSHPALPLLSPTEERLYRTLLAASPDFVDRNTLIRAVFGDEEDDGRLNLYIHYLRKKIETDGKKRIFAHRGKGYSIIC